MKEVISKTGLPDRCLVVVSNSTYLNIANFIEAFFFGNNFIAEATAISASFKNILYK